MPTKKVFRNSRVPKVKYIEPRTENQAEYIRAIAETDIIICDGPAGSGKTYIACALASHKFIDQEFDKIFITRSMVPAGREIGALKGELKDKIAPYFMPYAVYMEEFLGRAEANRLVQTKGIEYFPIELVRGNTYDNTFMIVDEAQNLTNKQLKLIMSRMGQNSKLIVLGDSRQADGKENALEFCVKFENLDFVSRITLDYGDIQRNEYLGRILEIFDKHGI
jgi:phosphate starvation-inducible PhoH-like protein